MATYINSQFAMRTGQGRHRRTWNMPRDFGLRLFTTLAAIAVAGVALAGAMVLLRQANLPFLAQLPSIALAFLSGASFMIMVLVVGIRGD